MSKHQEDEKVLASVFIRNDKDFIRNDKEGDGTREVSKCYLDYWVVSSLFFEVYYKFNNTLQKIIYKRSLTKFPKSDCYLNQCVQDLK